MGTHRRGAVALVVIAAALLSPIQGVRADPPELERRLRAARVRSPVRRKVAKAVGRGVTFLSGRQASDGSFSEHGGTNPALTPTTVTLYAALALRHAGTAKAAAACAKAQAWLFDGGKARLALLAGRVDHAGLALMLLHGNPDREETARHLGAVLLSSVDEASGWWKYATASAPPAGRPLLPDEPILDASQRAVLGLLAARARGIEVPAGIWDRHARALVSSQTTKYDSWPRRWSDRGGIGDTVGTFLGLTNLLAAQGARPDASAGLAAGVAAAIERARGVLGRDGGRTLRNPLGHFEVLGDDEGLVMPDGRKPPFEVIGRQEGRRDPLIPGAGAYARLFALACACQFADVETLETFPEGRSVTGRSKTKSVEVRCYEAAARWIVSVQQRGGGFASEADAPAAKPSETDTALALLVLTRAASAYHPSRPEPIDAAPR